MSVLAAFARSAKKMDLSIKRMFGVLILMYFELCKAEVLRRIYWKGKPKLWIKRYPEGIDVGWAVTERVAYLNVK